MGKTLCQPQWKAATFLLLPLSTADHCPHLPPFGWQGCPHCRLSTLAPYMLQNWTSFCPIYPPKQGNCGQLRIGQSCPQKAAIVDISRWQGCLQKRGNCGQFTIGQCSPLKAANKDILWRQGCLHNVAMKDNSHELSLDKLKVETTISRS